MFVLGCPSLEQSESEECIVISKIKAALSIPKGTSIWSPLREIERCKLQGKTYRGECKARSDGCPVPPKIIIPSVESQIVADSIESGNSIRNTHALLNTYRKEQEETPLSISAVFHCIHAMNPITQKVKKRKQGSQDKKSKWAQARLALSKQLLIRFGRLDLPGNQPPCYDKNKLAPLKITMIAWWDETHRKCVIGGVAGGSKKALIWFPRDKDGKVDMTGDTHKKKSLK